MKNGDTVLVMLSDGKWQKGVVSIVLKKLVDGINLMTLDQFDGALTINWNNIVCVKEVKK